MSNGKDSLFAVLEEKTGLKRVSDRAYGHLRFTPASAIVAHIKKNTVAVSFNTEGKEKSLSKDDHMKWANESGLLREEVQPGCFFELKQGAKDKSKSQLTVEIPYASDEQLDDPDFQNMIIGVVDLLKESLEGLVVPKNDKSLDTGIRAKNEKERGGIMQSNSSKKAKLTFILENVLISPYEPLSEPQVKELSSNLKKYISAPLAFQSKDQDELNEVFDADWLAPLYNTEDYAPAEIKLESSSVTANEIEITAYVTYNVVFNENVKNLDDFTDSLPWPSDLVDYFRVTFQDVEFEEEGVDEKDAIGIEFSAD